MNICTAVEGYNVCNTENSYNVNSLRTEIWSQFFPQNQRLAVCCVVYQQFCTSWGLFAMKLDETMLIQNNVHISYYKTILNSQSHAVKWCCTCNTGNPNFTSIPLYTRIYWALMFHTGFSSSEMLTRIQYPPNYFGVESALLFLMSAENKHQNKQIKKLTLFLILYN
jgi:hypothetical protein